MPIVRAIMQNPWALGFMSWCLICVPIIGIQLIHKYGWQHWEPFDKRHKQGYNTHIHNATMDYYSVEHWQEHWDELMNRVENGETIGIIGEDGNKAVMVPANEEITKLYTELNNEAQ